VEYKAMGPTEDSSANIVDWVPNLLSQVSFSLELATPEQILGWALETFGDGACIGTAFGRSGMAMIDMALSIKPDVDIFYIDTGLFFGETYKLIADAEQRYGRKFRRVTPESTVEEQGAVHGERLWERAPDKCCGLRKVVPLSRALEGKTAWLTALRRDQSPARRHAPLISWESHRRVVKIAPLVNVTELDVEAYIAGHSVPYNELNDRGYPSVGCVPCTSPARPGGDLRSGRWAGSSKTECGLHL
jgi:phosphoadenosine phosphosulfate reductase